MKRIKDILKALNEMRFTTLHVIMFSAIIFQVPILYFLYFAVLGMYFYERLLDLKMTINITNNIPKRKEVDTGVKNEKAKAKDDICQEHNEESKC